MSIGRILDSSLSALFANQRALNAVSTNVANLNTEGYARLDPSFSARSSHDGGLGVQARIDRIANVFLDAAAVRASADVGGAATIAGFLDRAQGLLGDPGDGRSVFAGLDDISASFGALAIDPASQVRSAEAVSAVEHLLLRLSSVATELDALNAEVASKLRTSAQEATSLLEGIAKLNPGIRSAQISGTDASAVKTEQNALIDRLSTLIDIRVNEHSLGGVEIRSGHGQILVGADASQIYVAAPLEGAAYGKLVLRLPESEQNIDIGAHLGGGELQGLARLRDRDIPDIRAALGVFASGVSEALNAAHNLASARPPPATLSGSDTGLLASDRLGFTGRVRIGLAGAEGRVTRNLLVDFDAGEIRDTTGAATPIGTSIGSFVAALNTALGAEGTASFTQGRLRIAAQNAGVGVVVAEDAATPSQRAGRGFSHSFGLNDLVVSGSRLGHATGVSLSDLHGFTPGETIAIGFRNADGALVSSRDYVVGGATFSDLIAGLNAAAGGLAEARLDAQGRITLTPASGSIARAVILHDQTRRGDTGRSLSDLFALGDGTVARLTDGLEVRSDIVREPQRLGVTRPRLEGAAIGAVVLASGDGEGASGLANSIALPRYVPAGGGLGSATESTIEHAARLTAHIGQLARSASSASDYATGLHDEIHRRRQAERGVNLDEELVKMTTYQQAYAAASRMMQAASDLYDILLRIV